MTIIDTETFTGSNGAAWPSPWTTVAGNTIQSNQGQMVAPAFSLSAAYLAHTALADSEVFLNFTPDASANVANTSLVVSLRANAAGSVSGSAFPPTTGISFQILQAGNVSLQHTVAGSTNFGGGGTTQSAWVTGTVYGCRVRATGTHIQVKWWDTAGAEPGTWNAIDTTDASAPTSAGCTRLGWNGTGSSSRTISIDNLTVDDLAAASNPPPIRTINRVPLVRAANF